MISRIIIYGLLGWNIEIIWTGFCALVSGDFNMIGHTSIWMFVIYGTAGAFFEKVHTRIRNRRWFERGAVWMYLIFAVEFISGGILKIIGITAWSYTGTFAVAQLIRLDYAPLWFGVGLIFEKVHDFALKISEIKIIKKSEG